MGLDAARAADIEVGLAADVVVVAGAVKGGVDPGTAPPSIGGLGKAVGGMIAHRGGSVSGAISTAVLGAGVQEGIYRASAYARMFSGSTEAVSITVAWNDGSPTVSDIIVLPMINAQPRTGVLSLYVLSGDITYSASSAGESGQYVLHMWLEAVGGKAGAGAE